MTDEAAVEVVEPVKPEPVPELVLELPTYKFSSVVPQQHSVQEPDPMPYFSDVHFASYDPVSGRILFLGSVPSAMLALQGANVVPGDADINMDYVLKGVLTKRPENTATIGGMTLLTLPVPCVITLEGNAYDCTDGMADLSFSQPGLFTVLVSAFPMLDASFEVTQT